MLSEEITAFLLFGCCAVVESILYSTYLTVLLVEVAEKYSARFRP